jgi:hypothetical protein
VSFDAAYALASPSRASAAGLAYDLSKELIVPIGFTNTNVAEF